MTLNKAKRLLCIGLFAAMPLSLMTTGCGGGGGSTPSSTRLAPTRLYSTWRLVSIGGGFTGQGQPVTQEETVTFRKDGTVQHVQGTQKSQGKYQVTRTSTFLGDKKPVLEYLSSSGSVSGAAFIINTVDDSHLELAEEANDGYGYGYERVP